MQPPKVVWRVLGLGVRLTRLRAASCGLAQLPRDIGRLKRLAELTLSHNLLEALPSILSVMPKSRKREGAGGGDADRGRGGEGEGEREGERERGLCVSGAVGVPRNR